MVGPMFTTHILTTDIWTLY